MGLFVTKGSGSGIFPDPDPGDLKRPDPDPDQQHCYKAFYPTPGNNRQYHSIFFTDMFGKDEEGWVCVIFF